MRPGYWLDPGCEAWLLAGPWLLAIDLCPALVPAAMLQSLKVDLPYIAYLAYLSYSILCQRPKVQVMVKEKFIFGKNS